MGRKDNETSAERNDTRRLQRVRFRKRLDILLEAAEDEAFCGLVWMVQALQSGRERLVSGQLQFPAQARTQKLGDPSYLPGWDLETVLLQRLAAPRFHPPGPGTYRRYLNCNNFESLARIVAVCRELENAEVGLVLRRMNVLSEMRRIAHRQFPWQRGFFNGPQIYRWCFLYSGPEAQAYFRTTYGLAISEFIRFGFMMHALFGAQVVWQRRPGTALEAFDLDQTEAALRLLAVSIDQARATVRKHHGTDRSTLYPPSHFRDRPIITFGGGARLRTPLRDLLLLRITSGLYYDLAGAPGRVRNEAARRFEIYTRDLLAASFDRLRTTDAPKYQWRGQPAEGPDVLVRDGNPVVAVFECKARKMSYRARFAEDPLAAGETGLAELAEGVFQLWKFFAHVRRGLIPGVQVIQDTAAVLLTLENWMTMSREFQETVLADAERLAAQRDPEIEACDRRTIVFASIEDLESTLERTDDDHFLANLRAAREERFTGWLLPDIYRDIDTGIQKEFPLVGRLGEVLPWLAELLGEVERDGGL